MKSVPLSNILARGGNNFDLVRVGAAAAVIVSHAFPIVHGPSAAEPLASVSVFTLGQHAVNVFFLLSGLLVSASLDRSRDLTSFAMGRVLRIFPGLVVCVLLTAVALGPLVSSLAASDYFASPATWKYVVATASLSTAQAPLPGVFEALPHAGDVNVPLWTLKYEMIAYALLAALAAVGVWSRPALFWLFLGALALAHQHLVAPLHAGDHAIAQHLLRFSLCFFLGAAAWRLRAGVRLSLPGAVAAVLALAAARASAVEMIVGYAAVFYLVLCLSALPAAGLRRVCAKADLSFGLYIYGWPVSQALLLAFPAIGPLALAATTLAVAAALAGLSWFLVERPALAMRPAIVSAAHALRPGRQRRAQAGTAG